MTTAQPIALDRTSDRYADIALGVECAWPLPHIALQLPEASEPSSPPPSPEGL